jgi:hypothetical protein
MSGGEKFQGPSVGRPLFHEFNSPLRHLVAPKVAHDSATRGEVNSLKLVWHNKQRREDQCRAQTRPRCQETVNFLSNELSKDRYESNRCHTLVPLAVREDPAYAERTLKGPG